MSAAPIFNDETVLARMRQAAALVPGSRVLDVGCGPGIVAESLSGEAGEVVGCDLTPEMLNKARERCQVAGLSNVSFVAGRAESLPFEDGSFDAIVSRSAVHHLPEPLPALQEMARVVRRGGRVVTVDVTSADLAADAALHNALEVLRDPSHARMLSRDELHAALARAGLGFESCTEWINHREFGEWLKITSAPERSGPLKVIMSALANHGAGAGIDLRLEDGKLLFEHHAALTVAVKPG